MAARSTMDTDCMFADYSGKCDDLVSKVPRIAHMLLRPMSGRASIPTGQYEGKVHKHVRLPRRRNVTIYSQHRSSWLLLTQSLAYPCPPNLTQITPSLFVESSLLGIVILKMLCNSVCLFKLYSNSSRWTTGTSCPTIKLLVRSNHYF